MIGLFVFFSTNSMISITLLDFSRNFIYVNFLMYRINFKFVSSCLSFSKEALKLKSILDDEFNTFWEDLSHYENMSLSVKMYLPLYVIDDTVLDGKSKGKMKFYNSVCKRVYLCMSRRCRSISFLI